MSGNLDLKSIRPKLIKLVKLGAAHATFTAVLLVLLAYLLVVWRISTLATSEPSLEAENTALTGSSRIPKVNKQAVEQIQKLEANSSDLKSIFNEARNNPFQEN